MFQNVFHRAIGSDDADNGKHDADDGSNGEGNSGYHAKRCQKGRAEGCEEGIDSVYAENADDGAKQTVLFENHTTESDRKINKEALEYGSNDNGNDPKPDLRTAVYFFQGFPQHFQNIFEFRPKISETFGITDGNTAKNKYKRYCAYNSEWIFHQDNSRKHGHYGCKT